MSQSQLVFHRGNPFLNVWLGIVSIIDFGNVASTVGNESIVVLANQEYACKKYPI
jgi:hypothetical protein